MLTIRLLHKENNIIEMDLCNFLSYIVEKPPDRFELPQIVRTVQKAP